MREMRLAVAAEFGDGSLPAEFVYDPARPMEVRLEFAPGSDNPIVWRLARSLLDWGLWAPETEPGGRGDVRIWRCPCTAHTCIWLHDRADGWAAACTVDRPHLLRWLASTYDAVGHDAEHCGLDGDAMDAAITALLEGTP